jgi:hypothetical protein
LVMIPCSGALALWHHHLILGVMLLVITVIGFEFSVVSMISLGTGLVAGSPAQGLGLLIGVDTIGRSLMSVPATRLYSSSGIGWPAMICACLAAVSVVAVTVSGRPANVSSPAPL